MVALALFIIFFNSLENGIWTKFDSEQSIVTNQHDILLQPQIPHTNYSIQLMLVSIKIREERK